MRMSNWSWRLPEGYAARKLATNRSGAPKLGGGKNLSCHFSAAELNCAAGIVLPGYGCPLTGSRTIVAGLRASNSEKSPRRIFTVGRLGVTMVDCLWRRASNVPKKKVLLRMTGPPTDAPKSLMMFCAFEGEKYGRALSDAVVFIQKRRPCS